ncbi:MAG: histidinol dehydrogenase, partial [Aurantimonas coralicida]
MPSRLNTDDSGFEAEFRALLGAKREQADDVDSAVRHIIARVREEGDAALIDLTRQFDGLDLTPEVLRVGQDEIDAAHAATPDETLAA